MTFRGHKVIGGTDRIRLHQFPRRSRITDEPPDIAKLFFCSGQAWNGLQVAREKEIRTLNNHSESCFWYVQQSALPTNKTPELVFPYNPNKILNEHSMLRGLLPPFALIIRKRREVIVNSYSVLKQNLLADGIRAIRTSKCTSSAAAWWRCASSASHRQIPPSSTVKLNKCTF